MKRVFAYLRTSSSTNENGQTWNRQKETILLWCKAAKCKLVEQFEETITGTTAERPVFSEMISKMAASDVKTFIVENQTRLGRDLMVNLHLISSAKKMGISIIDASTGDDLTLQDDPMMVAMTQISAVFAQLEKSQLVAKLRRSRDSKSKELGRRVEGRPKTIYPDSLIARVKAMRGRKRRIGFKSFQTIANILNQEGNTTPNGKRFDKRNVKAMLDCAI